MPKIGMESLYQGYLQNLEAEKNKQTRLPTAVQYTEKKPEERNDFDRFCMAVETMRKALVPNVPFGNDNFIRGYYEISKKRKHEIGEAEFTSVFGDLWDNFNEELGKHKDVVDRLKPEEQAAVRAVLDLKALVAPNGVVDPKSLDAQTAELGRNTALNNALAAAAKDPKMQDRIMAAEVNKLRGRRERNEFYEKAPEAPQRKNEDPQRGGPKLGG